jgi:cell division septation protein DedD
MGSIRSFFSFFPIFLLIFLLFSFPVYGQNGGGVAPGGLVGTEIQNIEKTLGSSGVSAIPAEGSGLTGPRRYEALVKLARLYELSGNIEGAAQAWTSAAAIDPLNQDMALIKGASCYAAMGEWDKAEEAAKTMFLTGRDKQSLIRARLLGAQIGAFRAAASPENSADSTVLAALLEDPDYEAFKPSIYYTLWKTSGDDAWKNRLGAEYPGSPEGRIAAGSGTAAEISAAPTAMWLLIPGRESIAAALPPAAATSVAAPAVPRTAAPATTSAIVPKAAPTPDSAGAGAAVLQTGLFGREGNAQVMADSLKAAGFSPIINRRTINGTEHWVVSVPAGSDMGAAINKLKNAGFESFPVFN